MNFWDDYHDPSKELTAKLSVENPDLKSIVEDPYCLGKMRDEDPKLMNFFSRPDTISQLIRGALDPDNEYPDEEIGKYSFNHHCTEVLCFKVSSFYDAIFAQKEAMEYLASYLHNYQEKLNHLLISFYCKIISALYVHNTNELINYFMEHKFLDAAFNCLEYGAVYELLVNLSARILPDDREPVKKWLVNEDFGKRMLEAFKKSDDFITMENIGFLWSEYVKALRDFCYAYEITDELLDNIQRPELVELLLTHMFPENKEARDWNAIVGGCIVIQAYYESSFDMNLPSMDITKTLTERPSKVIVPDPDFAVEKICSKYLAGFLEVGYEAWKQKDGDVMAACLATAEAILNSSQTEIHSVFVQQLKLFGFERWLTALKEDPTATIAVNAINAIVGLMLHSLPSVESFLIRYLITDVGILSIIMDAVANEPAQFSLVKLKAFRSCFYRLAERVEFARERSQNYDIVRKLISEAPEASDWSKFCEHTLKPYLAENLPEDSITNQTVSDLSTNLDLCVDEVMDVSGEDEDEKQTFPQTEFNKSPAHDVFEDLSQKIFPDTVEVVTDIPEATTANPPPAQSMEVDDWPTNSNDTNKGELENLFEKLKSSQPLDMSMNSSGEVVALTDSSVKSLNDTADFFAGLAPAAQSPPPEDDWPTSGPNNANDSLDLFKNFQKPE